MGALWCCSGLSDGFPTLLSEPNNYGSICLCGDLKLRTSPVKFSTQLHILQNIQRIGTHLSVHTNLGGFISGKQKVHFKGGGEKKGNMERFGRQAMNRGCPACSVGVLNSGKAACISQAYAAVTTATVQRAVLRGTVEWQPIGLHLSHFRQGKLIFPQERKLQNYSSHLGLGFPCWFIFLRMSG